MVYDEGFGVCVRECVVDGLTAYVAGGFGGSDSCPVAVALVGVASG